MTMSKRAVRAKSSVDRVTEFFSRWWHRWIRRTSLWGRAPGGDAQAYCDALAEQGIYLMPGTIFDRPEHFRISLTATMDTIERALPTLVAAASAPTS